MWIAHCKTCCPSNCQIGVTGISICCWWQWHRAHTYLPSTLRFTFCLPMRSNYKLTNYWTMAKPPVQKICSVTNFNNTFERPTTMLVESTFESPRNITRIITIRNLLESSLSEEFKSFFTTPQSRKGIIKSSLGRSLHYHEQDWWSDLLYAGKWQAQDEGSGTIYTSRLVEQTSSSDCLLWV